MSRRPQARMMTKLKSAGWLTSPKTQRVIAALEAVQPGCARFVGGCVRNTLMGRPVDDIDIATQLIPEEVIKAIASAGLRAVPTGIEHGTVTAICDGEPFEITTLRRDVETDGRRAVVAFTDDWAEDAMRRDFRCNALYAEPDGTLHDPVGGGIEDALHGRVIFIGDADQRLREDYLRILRFFRFNAWYGAGIDPDGLDACARQKEGLRQIAAERIWKELHKLLSASDPRDAICAMGEAGVLVEILPGVVPTDRLETMVSRVNKAGVKLDPLRNLMALTTPVEGSVSALASSLRLSNQDKARLENWVETRRGIGGRILSEAEVFREFYLHGTQAVLDFLIWRNPGNEGLSPDMLRQLFEMADSWNRPEFPISGDDALGIGLTGPEIGRALRSLEVAWVESDFTKPRDELLQMLRAHA